MIPEDIYKRAIMAADGRIRELKELVNKEDISDVIDGLKEMGPDCLPMINSIQGLSWNSENALTSLFDSNELSESDIRAIEFTIERLRNSLNE